MRQEKTRRKILFDVTWKAMEQLLERHKTQSESPLRDRYYRWKQETCLPNTRTHIPTLETERAKDTRSNTQRFAIIYLNVFKIRSVLYHFFARVSFQCAFGMQGARSFAAVGEHSFIWFLSTLYSVG